MNIHPYPVAPPLASPLILSSPCCGPALRIIVGDGRYISSHLAFLLLPTLRSQSVQLDMEDWWR